MWSATLFILAVGLVDASPRAPRHRPHGRVVTRVVYEEGHHHPEEHIVVRPKKRRRLRPRRPIGIVPADTVHPVAGFEGSYVAVAGTPGRGAVHVVEGVPALAGGSVTVVNGVRSVSHHGGSHVAAVPHLPPPLPQPEIHAVAAPALVPDHPLIARPAVVAAPPVAPAPTPRVVTGDRLPLPKCSYLNTDFVGDDLEFEADNGRVGEGINAGSARACKARCRLEEACNFWTYKEGASRDLLTRDCFLKEGTPGLPVPREAVPRLGFVSGTRDNNCICIKSEDEEDEVCPIKDPRGLVYPWRSLDDEENDLEKGLPPLGWNRGVYGALDPRLTPIVGDNLSSIGGNNLLEAQVKALRDQLDLLTRRLGNARARLETAPLEEGEERGEEEKEFTREEDRKPDFSDI